MEGWYQMRVMGGAEGPKVGNGVKWLRITF